MSSNIEVKKRCSWCENEFIARKTTTEYCSHRCSNLAYKAKKHKKKVKTFEQEYANKDIQQAEEVKHLEYLTPSEVAKLLNCTPHFILSRKIQRNSENRKLLLYGMTTGQTIDEFSAVR